VEIDEGIKFVLNQTTKAENKYQMAQLDTRECSCCI